MLKRFALVGLAVAVGVARADSTPETDPILDKAIAALGGEAKLKAAKVFTVKQKGTIHFDGNGDGSAFTSESMYDGTAKASFAFEGDFGGNKVKALTVVAGGKGWRKFGEMLDELKAEALAGELRTTYLRALSFSVLPLKGKEFKLKLAGEEKIGDKPAAGVTAVGPDGKDFKIWFDKDSGRPVKVSAKVLGFMGEEYVMDTAYSDYKEFGGVQVASKRTATRDGNKFVVEEVTDFKALAEAPAKAFDQPQ